MAAALIEEGKFKYIEIGTGEPILLLHGLFGGLSNFDSVINHFSKKYRIIVPELPIFDLPVRDVTLENLVAHILEFIEFKKLDKINIMGNSLGGHIALLCVLAVPNLINSIILTGSSGLFENALGSSMPPRSNYELVKKKTELTFFNPEMASKELVDEVFETINDRNRAIRIIYTAKSAIRHNLSDRLDVVKSPTLLIWGKNDIITPPMVAEKFNELMENSELFLFDECGHAPMMEHPERFNDVMDTFLDKVVS